MSYVPPHKRHESGAVKSTSVPPSLLTKFNRNLGSDNYRKKIYADDCISRWFVVSPQDDNNLKLVPVSSDSAEGKRVAEENSSFLLVKSDDFSKLETPWLWVAEKVEDDLILGFGRAKETLRRYGPENVKLRLIARFGKILFNRVGSSEIMRDGLLTKSKLEKMKKSFNTNVSKSYVENIESGVVPKIGFCAEKTKEMYYVQVSDKSRPAVTIFCRCKVDQQHKRLNFYKAEHNSIRHLILDVSCLDQDLDLRLMVDSTLINLSEDEMKNLKELTDAAVIDPNVKGGLKWPLGKSSCADRYSVCGVWHTVTTSYLNPNLRLRVREADRYDFKTGMGETSKEVILKLKALNTKLLEEEEEVVRKCASDMLKDYLKTVWDYFLKAV